MRFDGLSVEHHQGRFSGAFDVETKDGETYLKYGNTVILLVVGTVGQAVMKEDKLGDMMRTSTVIVDTAEFVAPQDLSAILTQLGVSHQLSLTEDTEPEAEQPWYGDGDDGHIVTPEGEVVSPSGDVIDTNEDEEEEEPEEPVRAPAPVQDSGERQVVGRVRPPKDPALARFLAGSTS